MLLQPRRAVARREEEGMPILAALIFVIQICFAYHALKTGRPYWWLFIIMGFPVMGCVLY